MKEIDYSKYVKQLIDGKLLQVKTRVNNKSHIKVDQEVCRGCVEKICVFACPAGCYQVVVGVLKFSHDGCLECGTCQVVCARGAVKWGYPQGGFGINYRFS